MKTFTKHPAWIAVSAIAAVALLFSVVLMLGSCGEEIDNWTSEVACRSYCDKAFSCRSIDPTDDENNLCVSNCRTDMEERCGNEHQAAANAKIFECVDMGCVDFIGCMMFEAHPVCYGFVGRQ